MPESPLPDLAARGLQGAPEAAEIARWCWERAENTGDARYCGLARLLETIVQEWDHFRALPGWVVDRTNSILTAHLPAVEAAENAADGSSLARLLREEVLDVFREWNGEFWQQGRMTE